MSNRAQRKVVPENRTTIVDNRVVDHGAGRGGTGIGYQRPAVPSRVAYHDRPHSVRHIHRYEHVYTDYRGRICHRIVSPRYRFMVHYNRGPRFTFRYVHPFYHRKYVFVSLGGYWPVGYRHVRYYWYGCHPYQWYGYYPIARQVRADTDNYYTYNYYYDNATAHKYSQVDVREELTQQATEEPDLATLADGYFEVAVKAFEDGDFRVAAEGFAKVMTLAPDDMVVPFAYSQALVANKRYSEAAQVLRAGLAKVSPDKEGVFYPRGLYRDDETLFEQIDHLAQEAKVYSFDADLQLLLGYQLLGVGEIDEAVEPLQRASQDSENAAAATILLDLLKKIRVESAEVTDTD